MGKLQSYVTMATHYLHVIPFCSHALTLAGDGLCPTRHALFQLGQLMYRFKPCITLSRSQGDIMQYAVPSHEAAEAPACSRVVRASNDSL